LVSLGILMIKIIAVGDDLANMARACFMSAEVTQVGCRVDLLAGARTGEYQLAVIRESDLSIEALEDFRARNLRTAPLFWRYND
jgi:hypothetical protein